MRNGATETHVVNSRAECVSIGIKASSIGVSVKWGTRGWKTTTAGSSDAKVVSLIGINGKRIIFVE